MKKFADISEHIFKLIFNLSISVIDISRYVNLNNKIEVAFERLFELNIIKIKLNN